jgi:RNA polymerase sigma factor (sigma-70 family)
LPSPTTVLLRTQTDERLVALAQAGSERAFEAIVERYRRSLMRACRRVLPEARAEDAVQLALMAAWAGLARGDGVRDLRSWLYRIAHNAALNQLRVSGYDYDELHGLLSTGPAPEEELERREVARRTLIGLAALPERQREALLQIAVEGRGQEEVAHALGISEPAVRQLVHRARSRLRAAATAVTPLPLAAWLAQLSSHADLAASGSSVAATVTKVGAMVVLAGGAAAGPSVVDRFEHGGASPRPRASAPHGAAVADAAPARRVPTATPVPSPAHAALVTIASSGQPPPSGGGAQPAPALDAKRHESNQRDPRARSTHGGHRSTVRDKDRRMFGDEGSARGRDPGPSRGDPPPRGHGHGHAKSRGRGHTWRAGDAPAPGHGHGPAEGDAPSRGHGHGPAEGDAPSRGPDHGPPGAEAPAPRQEPPAASGGAAGSGPESSGPSSHEPSSDQTSHSEPAGGDPAPVETGKGHGRGPGHKWKQSSTVTPANPPSSSGEPSDETSDDLGSPSLPGRSATHRTDARHEGHGSRGR